jgi:uncharacterized protein
MPRTRIFFAASAVVALVLAASSVSSLSGAGTDVPEMTRRYGTTVTLGNAHARAYVNVDDKSGAALEIGVALDEKALEGLPSSGTGHHGTHVMPHTYILELPEQYAKPFKFVELNWNPAGHEPTGVYEGVPHFDFHFYTITQAEREAIVPSDPKFAAKANNVPASEYVPPFNAALAPPGLKPADVAVPKMGVHWVDVRSPELQRLLNKPEAYKPFTATFIHGSWDGRVTFWEPMITRAHILEKRTATDPAVRDQIIPIPTPARYQAAGYYPSAYRITWDGKAKEYRIALTQLTWRE